MMGARCKICKGVHSGRCPFAVAKTETEGRKGVKTSGVPKHRAERRGSVGVGVQLVIDLTRNRGADTSEEA
jgi:hypothetical protein